MLILVLLLVLVFLLLLPLVLGVWATIMRGWPFGLALGCSNPSGAGGFAGVRTAGPHVGALGMRTSGPHSGKPSRPIPVLRNLAHTRCDLA